MERKAKLLEETLKASQWNKGLGNYRELRKQLFELRPKSTRRFLENFPESKYHVEPIRKKEEEVEGS